MTLLLLHGLNVASKTTFRPLPKTSRFFRSLAPDLAREWAGTVVNFFNFIWLHIGVADVAKGRLACDYVELRLADFVH